MQQEDIESRVASVAAIDQFLWSARVESVVGFTKARA